MCFSIHSYSDAGQSISLFCEPALVSFFYFIRKFDILVHVSCGNGLYPTKVNLLHLLKLTCRSGARWVESSLLFYRSTWVFIKFHLDVVDHSAFLKKVDLGKTFWKVHESTLGSKYRCDLNWRCLWIINHLRKGAAEF